jgi:hypothetical protein
VSRDMCDKSTCNIVSVLPNRANDMARRQRRHPHATRRSDKPLAADEFLAWLASEKNGHMTGRTIYIDGGADAVIRSAKSRTVCTNVKSKRVRQSPRHALLVCFCRPSQRYVLADEVDERS